MKINFWIDRIIKMEIQITEIKPADLTDTVPLKDKDSLFEEIWSNLTEDKKQSVRDRLNKYLRKDGEHLIWIGGGANGSYNFSINKTPFAISRVSWRIFGGEPLTPNRYIQQICGHDKCFCKDHLVALTRSSPTSKGAIGATPDDWIYACFLITSHSEVDARSEDEHDGVIGDHLIWTGKLKGDYGAINWRHKDFPAHVLSWIIFNNVHEVPENMVVRHKCKEKRCVAPDHLEIGTREQNAQDKIRDGTLLCGENHPNATITEETAIQIRESKGQGTQKERAERFSVSKVIVSNIDQGRCWNEPGQGPKIDRKPLSPPTPEQITQWLPEIESRCTKIPVDSDDPILETTDDPRIRDHWIWNLAKDHGGYPCINLKSLNCGSNRAHRVALMSYQCRLLDKNEVARHLCDKGQRRDCCNPLHLVAGTHTQNGQDRIEHGIFGKGETHPNAKLTENDVREIRRRYESGETQISLASEYKVSQSTIRDVMHRRSWKHVI